MKRRIEVSIGEVKRDLSELINRVAFGGEQVILTSRGKPKAALISIAELERLGTSASSLEAWVEKVRQRSQGDSLDLDLDGLLETLRDEHDAQILGD